MLRNFILGSLCLLLAGFLHGQPPCAHVEINLGGSRVICPGDSIWLDVSSYGYGTVYWNDGSTGNLHLVTSPGYVSVMADNGCDWGEAFFYAPDEGVFPWSDTTVFCSDVPQVWSLFANVSGDSLLWSTGSSDSYIEPTTSGWYSLSVTTSCTTLVGSTFVAIADVGEGFRSDTVPLCKGYPVDLSGKRDWAISYSWSDRQDLNAFQRTVSEAGVYYLTASRGACQRSQRFRVVEQDCECIRLANRLWGGSPESLEVVVDCALDDLQLLVYDRNGRLIFRGVDEWNPGLAANGYYFYRVLYRVKGRDQFEAQTGTISLLR